MGRGAVDTTLLSPEGVLRVARPLASLAPVGAAKPANAQLAMGDYKPSLVEGLRFGPISITLVLHD